MKVLSKADLAWLIKSGEKDKLLDFCYKVIESENFCVRDKLRAAETILKCNGQNIQLCDDVAHENQITIKVEHPEST